MVSISFVGATLFAVTTDGIVGLATSFIITSNKFIPKKEGIYINSTQSF